MCVIAAAVVIRSFAGEVVHAREPAGGVEHQLGKAAVEVFAGEPQEVRVLVVTDRQLPAVGLAGGLVAHLDGHNICTDFKDLFFRNLTIFLK